MIQYLFLILSLSCAFSNAYDRRRWPHWIDEDRDCRNTRQEILLSRSTAPVILNTKGCTVRGGLWDDYYFAEVHRTAAAVNIDHLVPLKHAFDRGGAQWSKAKRRAFANDPMNLVITNRTYNRQKGAKGIHEWLPIDRAYACKYVRDWFAVKGKYELRVTEAERITESGLGCAPK